MKKDRNTKQKKAKDRLIACRLPNDDREALEAIATEEDRPISSIMRKAIRYFVERHKSNSGGRNEG